LIVTWNDKWKLSLWPKVASKYFVIDVCTGNVFDRYSFQRFLMNPIVNPMPTPIVRFPPYGGTFVDSLGHVRRGYKDPKTGIEHLCTP
jgi:hypothetical protein